MLKRIFFNCFGILSILIFSTTVWALDFNPGQYEITSKVEMTGMPETMPPTTITQCLTEQDPVPKNNSSGQDCEIKNMKQTSDTVTWEMECLQQDKKMVSKGKMIYKGDTFQGSITLDMGPDAGNMIVTTKVSGKRIGDCQ